MNLRRRLRWFGLSTLVTATLVAGCTPTMEESSDAAADAPGTGGVRGTAPDATPDMTLNADVAGGADATADSTPAADLVPPVEEVAPEAPAPLPDLAPEMGVPAASSFVFGDAFEILTGEDGRAATFTIKPKDAPSAAVQLSLSSRNSGEAIVAPEVVTFTAADWMTPKTITVTGVNDAVVDGHQSFVVSFGPASSDDPRFAGVQPDERRGRNLDDDHTPVAFGLMTVPPTCPRLTAGPSSIVAAEDGALHITLNCTDGSSLVISSHDGGKTFGAPVAVGSQWPINEVAAGGDGLIYAGTSQGELWRSDDGGETFAELEDLVPDGRAGAISLLTAVGGRLTFLLRLNQTPVFNAALAEVYLVTSDDGGATLHRELLPQGIRLVALGPGAGKVDLVVATSVAGEVQGTTRDIFTVKTTEDGGKTLSVGQPFASTFYFRGDPRTRVVFGRHSIFAVGEGRYAESMGDVIVASLSNPAAAVRVPGGFADLPGVIAMVDATDTVAVLEQQAQVQWLLPGATALGTGRTFTWSPGDLSAASLSPHAVAVIRHAGTPGQLSFALFTRP